MAAAGAAERHEWDRGGADRNSGAEEGRRRLPRECSHHPIEPCRPAEDWVVDRWPERVRMSVAAGARAGEARGTGGGSAPARPAPESWLREDAADQLGGTDVACRHRRRCLHSRSRRFTATDIHEDRTRRFQTNGTPQPILFRLFPPPPRTGRSGNIRVIGTPSGRHPAASGWLAPTATADARRRGTPNRRASRLPG